MVEPALLKLNKHWQPQKRVLGRLPLVIGFVVVAISAAAWLRSTRSSDGFYFKAFEGDGSAPRLHDARVALEKIVPVGSTMAEYDSFFLDHGGQCSTVADAVRFPNTAVCSYAHGFLISAEWKYVIEYDPVTLRSKHTDMNSGLTGP